MSFGGKCFNYSISQMLTPQAALRCFFYPSSPMMGMCQSAFAALGSTWALAPRHRVFTMGESPSIGEKTSIDYAEKPNQSELRSHQQKHRIDSYLSGVSYDFFPMFAVTFLDSHSLTQREPCADLHKSRPPR